MTIALHQPAPNFSLPATNGQIISLDELRGNNVVVYFYPKDSTPGCTSQGQCFTANYAQFLQHDAIVLGISRDSLPSHTKFKVKFNFAFELLSDLDGTVCALYDVIKTKNLYGKMVQGIERSTFLIDKAGIVQAAWRKVKVAEHIPQVLLALEQL
jgi:peroxiredoxin Q/BCP